MLKGTDTKSLSVRTKLSLLMFAIILFSVCFMAIINWLFLDKYYLYKTKENYEKSYFRLKSYASNNELGNIAKLTGLDYLAKDISNQYNCTIVIKYYDDRNRYFSFSVGNYSESFLLSKLTDYEIGNLPDNFRVEKTYSSATLQVVDESIVNGDKTKWIEMWGNIDKNISFLMTSNYNDIEKAANTSTEFVMLIGIACAFISMIIAYTRIKKFSQPIKDINNLTKEMCKMNFDVKYNQNSYTEINELGYNVNKMSDCIHNVINELKTANVKLKHDIIKYEEVDDMRKEFISNVSHELKTPIALIMGYAEGLKLAIEDKSEEDRQFYCDVIIDESKRMNKMVKDLLMLNELEFGIQDYHIENFDIVEFVRNISESYRIIIESKGINFNIDDRGPIYVWTDPSKMETVIRNFITNAFNHVDENKVINIKFKIQDNSKRVRIGVFNSGKPIDIKIKNRIWDKFYKVDKARTRSYGGNGVGLSIVKAILDPLKRPYGCVNRSNGVEFFFELDTTDAVLDLVKKNKS